MKQSGLNKKHLARILISDIETNKNCDIATYHLEEYEKPQKIVSKEIKNGFVPDILVNNKSGQRDIYEIELNDEINPDKWNLFSRFAVINKGEFFIVLPEWLMPKAKTEIKTHQLKNIHLLYFKDKN